MHKQLQAAVAAAVHKAYGLLTQPPASTAAAAAGAEGSWQQQQQQQSSQLLLQPNLQLTPQLFIAAASVSSYSLKLAKPLTSTDSKAGAAATAAGAPQHRRGLLLNLTLAASQSATAAAAAAAETAAVAGYVGVGEAAPLPGLHTESFEQASEQLQMLSQLLQGLSVPETLPLLGSNSMMRWFRSQLGLDPAVLYPSVRFAVESAVLQALAAAKGCSLQEMLQQQQQQASGGSSSSTVQVNGLLPGSGSVEQLVSAGQALAAQGYKAIKVKVGRR
jgi:isochorismate synthase/2-succinyl-5-enolpyruvyl-6-hydroxy-3-cyclohexene-1-carboxylate synthase/2-succinyl-6-hydroxy-2,4-cyclohexadiene-1-carboxylate synthase/O-succinylbenzoate synthase